MESSGHRRESRQQDRTLQLPLHIQRDALCHATSPDSGTRLPLLRYGCAKHKLCLCFAEISWRGMTMPLKTEDVSRNGTAVAVHHPLDPLTASEITEVTRILEDHFQWGSDLRVETIDTNEPAKDLVRYYDAKNPLP